MIKFNNDIPRGILLCNIFLPFLLHNDSPPKALAGVFFLFHLQGLFLIKNQLFYGWFLG
jgi:hypothetical protein